MKESECDERLKNPRNPYFQRLKREGAVCPSCGHRMWLKMSTGSDDLGFWKCDNCGYLVTVVAPEGQRMGDGPGGEVLRFRPRGGERGNEE